MIPRIAAFLLAAFLVPATQRRLDGVFQKLGPEPDVSSVWTGPVVRAFSLGFSDVLADVYWLRAVQYYGRQKLLSAPTGYADLAPLLNTASELDPRFEIVYRYGAIFLSEPRPVGAGRAEAGIAFLKKGADRNPTNWRLRQEQGFFTFLYLDDGEQASQVLLQASKIAGSADWLKSLAAQVLAHGGSLEASLQMWMVIREQSAGPMRENADSQIKVVQNRIVARNVQDQVTEHRRLTDDRSSSLDDLRARGVIRTSTDLAGVPFAFDPESGTVAVSRKSPLWRQTVYAVKDQSTRVPVPE